MGKRAMNFLLFNGPPRSGKDTAALAAFKAINETKVSRAYWEKFSMPNKLMFAALTNTKLDWQGNNDKYEEIKEQVLPGIEVSYRQFQIDVSEKFFKPVYGNDIFGKLLLRRSMPPPYINVVSDCGFQIECDVLKDHNVCLISIHRDGTSFANDSRQWVRPHENWYHFEIDNSRTKEGFEEKIAELVGIWIKNTL